MDKEKVLGTIKSATRSFADRSLTEFVGYILTGVFVVGLLGMIYAD